VDDPYIFKLNVRLDQLQIHYEKKTYGIPSYLAEITGIMKILMVFGGVTARFVSKRIFMADILKELFLVKRCVTDDL